MALTDNLISYWAIDEVSGNRTDSVAATANTLTDNNTVTSGTGLVYPLAGQFTSANSEYLSHVDNTSLSVGGTSFTFIAWINMDSTAGNRFIVTKDDVGTNREYALQSAGGFARLETWTGSGGAGNVSLDCGTSMTTATWYMIMVKSDQTTNYISVNDANLNTIGAVNAGWDGAAAFQIGARAAANFFSGRIGPVAFWKRALSSGEITTLYNAGAGYTYAQILGSWGKLLGQELNRLVVP